MLDMPYPYPIFSFSSIMWLFLTLISYFIFAAVIIIDKYFLEKPLPEPKVFTFYTAFAGIIFFLVAPFALQFPEFKILALNFISGGVFIAALFSLYKSFKLEDISKIVSGVGALTAIFIYFFNYFFFDKIFKFFVFGPELNEQIISFSYFKITGLFFLFAGYFIIFPRFNQQVFITSVLYALFFVLAKIVYLSQPFVSGFLWLKMGGFLWGFIFLFSPEVRKHLTKIHSFKNVFFEKHYTSLLLTLVFIFKLALGGIANIFQNLAIFLAPLEKLSVIKALEGSQYLFIFFFAFILTKKYPRILKEEIRQKILFQKLAGIIIIIAGIIFLNI